MKAWVKATKTGKRDWLILIGYVALIYATLPFMPRIVFFFSSLLGRYFYIAATATLIGFLFIISAIILRRKSAPKNHMFYIEAAIIFALCLFFLLFATPIIAEKLHLLEYGFLSYLALRAVKEVPSRNKRYLYVVLIVILVGCCDELIQKFTPGRYCEIRDMVLNIVSGILGLLVLRLYEKTEHY